MNKILIIFTYLTCLVLLTDCSQKEKYNSESKISNKDQAMLLEVDNSVPFNWPKNLEIKDLIILETKENFLISFMRKMIVSPNGDLFYIFDYTQQKILIFDKNGDAQEVFDHQGQGPEEYLEVTDFQIDFENNIIEVLDYQKIKKYNLETFKFIETENLSHLPKDKNFRNFARIEQVLYLWTNLPPNQIVSKDQIGDFHLVRVDGEKVTFHVKKKYGVINGQIFYPTPSKHEFNIPPIVGSDEIITVTKDSIYSKNKFSYGNKGIPLHEMVNFWERQKYIFNSNYYKPFQNIRETTDFIFFQFAGNMEGYNVLLDKKSNSIISIGKSEDKLDPALIYSDENYFYGYLSPGFIKEYLDKGGDLSKTTFFKNLDISKLDKYDNPIIVKFKIHT